MANVVNEVTYVRSSQAGMVDYAAAVIDIVSSSPDPVQPGQSALQRASWAHKHGFTYCTWKRRFIRLERTSLSYYKQESSTTPKGVIPLTPYTICKTCNKGDNRNLDAVGYVKLVNGAPVVEKVLRENGIALQVPECARTYYFHFPSARDRDEWAAAVNNNLEIMRRTPGVIEAMISKVEPIVANGTLPREKFGIIKMALRGRFHTRSDPAAAGPFPAALAAISLSDIVTLRRVLVPEIVAMTTAAGTTLLTKACGMGNLDVVRAVLDAGAAVDQAKADGDTPLIIAARLNHVSVVRVLLERGAKRDLANEFKETAASEGRHSGNQVLDLLSGTSTSVPVEEVSPGLSPQELQDLIAVQTEALVRAQAALAVARTSSSAFSDSISTLDLPPGALEQVQAVAAGFEQRRQTLEWATFDKAGCLISRLTDQPKDVGAGSEDHASSDEVD